MEAANRTFLAQSLTNLGLVAPEAALDQLAAHLAAVVEWNQRFNLTRITDEREAVIKHVLDSAACWWVVKPRPGMRVLDLGSGAGFPGIVLKVLFPGADMVLLEATQKKCGFLEHVRAALGLSGLSVVWGRAEAVAHEPQYREAFDLVAVRAVAEMRTLAELALPFVKVGGRLVAMKGPGGAAEAEEAAEAIARVGGGRVAVKTLALPEGAGERTLIVVEKVGGTPQRYPRKAGSPEKQPL